MINPLSATDRAIVAYLISEGVGTSDNVYRFKRSEDKALPCVIVWTKSGSPISASDGTYEVEVSILIRSNSALDVGETESTQIDADDEIVANTYDALHKFGNGSQSGQEMAEAISTAFTASGAEEFTCQNFEITRLDQALEARGGTWEDEISLRLVVSSSAAG